MLYPKRTRTRGKFELDGIWQLARETKDINYAEDFTPEKQVAVPSSFNDLYTENEFRMWEKGIWYSRRFYLPAVLKNQRIVLRFGSVSYRASVYLNGKKLGEHETGYTPFEFDVTDAASFDKENLLCVRVENTLSAETVPMGNLDNETETGQISGQYPNTPFDFFPYAGIHRPVSIYSTGKTAWLDEIILNTAIDKQTGKVELTGKADGCADKVRIEILETKQIIETDVNSGSFKACFEIENVKLWDVYQPNLYNARIQLLNTEGNLLDEYIQQFGVRTIVVRGNRLLLNGSPVYLKGFGRHEDFDIIGKGLNHSVNIRDHELLKWINANSYRTTHYPYSEELIQLADQQGILLISEAPAVSMNIGFATEKTLQTHLQVMKELIERDRNNPSVIMWSVANEATSDRKEAKPYFKALSDLTRSMDPTRPVIMASCKYEDDAVTEYFDIVSVNLYPGWYHLPGQIKEAKEDMKRTLQKIYKKFNKPILVSEFGAGSITGFHNLPADQWSEEYQKDLILSMIEIIRECDFIIGEHVWNFADFRTGQNFFRVGGNKKGVFTRQRQPKMAAHFLKEVWKNTDR